MSTVARASGGKPHALALLRIGAGALGISLKLPGLVDETRDLSIAEVRMRKDRLSSASLMPGPQIDVRPKSLGLTLYRSGWSTRARQRRQ